MWEWKSIIHNVGEYNSVRNSECIAITGLEIFDLNSAQALATWRMEMAENAVYGSTWVTSYLFIITAR